MKAPPFRLLLPPLAVALALACTAGCGGAAQEAGDSDSDDTTAHAAHGRGVVLGKPAPVFAAKRFGSKERIFLKRLRGQVVLVDFWGTFCEPCKKSFPKLQELSDKYASQGLEIVGISEDEADDKDKIPTFAEKYGAKFTVAWDEDKSIAEAYKPPTMPSSFLIDKHGIVRFAHAGYHEGEEVQVEKEIQQLLAK